MPLVPRTLLTAAVELLVAVGGKDVSETPRRQVLLAAMVVVSVAFGGCLTLNPSVTVDTADSRVFESISVNEPWSSQRVRASATLASSPEAGNVTQLTVINADGDLVSTVNVSPGQTSVTLMLPANANATIVASDTINGTTIEKLNVTTDGDRIP